MTPEERNAIILQMRNEGQTYKAIGQLFGLTKQRVHQIVNGGLSTTQFCKECSFYDSCDKRKCQFR